MTEDITVEKVQALITRAPYHQWLGLKVVAVNDDGIELSATWREEWVVNPDRRYTHGGILAALVDLAADWAMVKKTGRGVPTIDLRVDYHAAAMPGDLTARGKVVRMGGQFSTAEAHVFDKVAVIDLGGGQVPREYTYAQLDAMTNAVARALLKRGLVRGERVAILSANRVEFLAAYFGIMRAGLVAVPVNFKFPRQTIHFIMQDAGARFVFCDRARRADCPAGLPVVIF